MYDDRAERDDPGSHDLRDGDGRSWSKTLAWAPFLVLMWVVFELTADHALGIAAGCVKFGLKDLGTARWLRRVDPVRVRGRACSWFCATRGILKIGFTAYLALNLGFAIDAFLGFGGPANAPFAVQMQMLMAILTIVASIALASMTAMIGVLIAWRAGIKVWVDFDVNRAHKIDLWPPFGIDPRGRLQSFAGLVVLLAVLGACLVIETIYFTLGFMLFVDFRDNRELLALFGGGLAILLVGLPLLARYLGRRVIAALPWECYPLE